MKYNFETIRPRYDVNSFKWNEMKEAVPDLEEGIIPFSIADMEFETAPEIVAGLKAYLDRYVLGYSNPTDRFKESVVQWMKNRHHWEVKKEWMLFTHGIVSAFYMAVHVFTEPGDGVMLMTPCYYPMYHAIENNNRVLVNNAMIQNGDHYEIDFDDFEKKAKDPKTKLLILCSPHNPTGRVFTREELTRIGRICIDNHVMICDDEIHNDLIMPGYEHIVFGSISKEFAEHSMICIAPSKTFNLAGLQTSTILIANPEIRERFLQYQCRDTDAPKCNVLGYEANRIAYEECGGWLDECIQVINRNRMIIEEFFSRELPQIKVTRLEATYLLWMDFREFGIEAKKLSRILRVEGHLFFDDGYMFGQQGTGFERWNLACPTSYIQAALIRLKKALAPYI
ncbi:MAG: MalY/PatB family protein [Lachnospiraceae bacterium]|nr:MalY/PatB family protein [Lachnospiraceae bacterium]